MSGSGTGGIIPAVPVEFRSIRPEELAQFADVNLTAFGERGDPWFERWFRERVKPQETIAAFADGQMVGSSLAFPLELALPGTVVTASGVTAVGVLPTHRRRGLLREMMTRQLLGARDQGLPMAILWASEGAIYSRFGFGPAARSWRVALEHPRAQLVPLPTSGSLRMVGRDEALQRFPPLHDHLLQSRPGTIGRDQRAWEMSLSEDDPHLPRDEARLFLLVHQGDGGDDGYLVYRIRQAWSALGARSTLLISEMVANAPGAAADMWRYCLEVDLVHRVEASGRGLRPLDDPILWLAKDPQALELGLGTTIWARIIDVSEVLSARRYQRDGDLTIEVSDPVEHLAEGRFRLHVANGVGECRKTESSPDLILGVSELSSACLGQRCLADLAAAGRLSMGDPAAARRADDLLAWDPPPWCFEDF